MSLPDPKTLTYEARLAFAGNRPGCAERSDAMLTAYWREFCQPIGEVCGQPITASDLDRFRAFCRPLPNGCIEWMGAKSQGYGSFRVNGKSLRAHIVSYELGNDPVPPGLVLDHTCHNSDAACVGGAACPHRACVNPLHLEPVTRGVNVARSRLTVRIDDYHRGLSRCPAGHPYSGANLRLRPDGSRACRTCERVRAWERRNRR